MIISRARKDKKEIEGFHLLILPLSPPDPCIENPTAERCPIPTPPSPPDVRKIQLQKVAKI
jgi:hypothetical protein